VLRLNLWEKSLIPVLISTMLFFVYLRHNLLINVNNYPFDDGLFIARAEGFVLGNEKSLESTRGFNPLVKGQIYPQIIVIANILNLNPIVFVYVLLIITIILFITLVYIRYKSLLLISLVFCFTLFDPSPFSSQASRISREMLYQVGVLLLFLMIVYMRENLSKNNKLSIIRVILLGVITGALIFCLNNIREEREWIYLIYIAGMLWIFLKNYKNYISVLLFIIITTMSYTAATSFLKNYNLEVYGVNLTSTTIEGEFPELMANLSSIKTSEDFQPYVSISRTKREIAYSISPSFAQLRNYLEGDGTSWFVFGCENLNICDDYANGWFHVALRVGIDQQANWINQRKAQDFMSSINQEILKACKDKQIECVKPLPLAKALGVTQITKAQILGSSDYLFDYFNKSVFGWNKGGTEFLAHNTMPAEQWSRWTRVIKTIPADQVEYQNQYNHRVGFVNGIYLYWVNIYKLFVVTGCMALILILLNSIYCKNRKRVNIVNKELIFIANFSLFIWFSRGILLSLNSVTNIVSISENYSLPGRVFLPISLAIYIYVVIKYLDSRSQSK
jgi:hypothetical protein